MVSWEQELLTRLVALNAQRAAEEANGQIRYLRPEYQRKTDSAGRTKPEQSPLALHPPNLPSTISNLPSSSPRKKPPWPRTLADRVRLIDETLRTTPGPHTPESLAKSFARAGKAAIAEILETLTALGRAAKAGDEFTSVG